MTDDSDIEMALYALSASIWHLESYLSRKAELGSYRHYPNPELRVTLQGLKKAVGEIRNHGGFR